SDSVSGGYRLGGRGVAYRATSPAFGGWSRHSPAIGAASLRVSAFHRHSVSQLRVDDERRACGAGPFLSIAHHTTIRPRRFYFGRSEHSAFDLFYSPPRLVVDARRLARQESCDLPVNRPFHSLLAIQDSGDEKSLRARLASWLSFLYNTPRQGGRSKLTKEKSNYEAGLRLHKPAAIRRQRFDNYATHTERSIEIARRTDQLRRDRPLRRRDAFHRGAAETHGQTARRILRQNRRRPRSAADDLRRSANRPAARGAGFGQAGHLHSGQYSCG